MLRRTGNRYDISIAWWVAPNRSSRSSFRDRRRPYADRTRTSTAGWSNRTEVLRGSTMNQSFGCSAVEIALVVVTRSLHNFAALAGSAANRGPGRQPPAHQLPATAVSGSPRSASRGAAARDP
jgi:hypothetical protein